MTEYTQLVYYQNMNLNLYPFPSEISELTDRLIPLTYFRRNAGKIFATLSQKGSLVLTKGGQPIAALVQLSSAKTTPVDYTQTIKNLAGGIKTKTKLTPNKINQIISNSYEKLLP